MAEHATLIKPPPVDDSKSSIENVLELTPLTDIGPDIFTNTRPLWQPLGARGIYGGAVIAQSLSAAQQTIPPHFTIHSMHCYFVLAGDAGIPICYHVEHVREGRSFATRTVQARQRGKPIFTVTMSFMKEGSGGHKLLEHAATMPEIPDPDSKKRDISYYKRAGAPFQTRVIDTHNGHSPYPHEKKTRHWVKASGTISPEGGHQAHLSALAYMSDSWFLGTISRVHGIGHFSNFKDTPELKSLREADKLSHDVTTSEREISMLVSLDHTIYFHSPRDFKADEWLFTEMESPWSGDGRALVMQRIFTKEGRLVASCIQEGLVRLNQESRAFKSNSKL